MIQDKAHLSKLVNFGFLSGITKSVNTDQEFPVYHYTSTDGLIGILTRKELWLGNIDDLNDITELNYGFDNIIIPAIDSSNEISEESRQKVRSLIADVRNKTFSLTKEQDAYKCSVNIFVFSTSTSGNAYTMWSNYSKNDNKAGYAISLGKSEVTEAIVSALNQRTDKPTNIISNYFLSGKIVYKVDDQKRLVEDYLSLLEYNLENKSEEFKDIIYNAFVEGLLILALFMKDEEFSKENEYRYIVLLADESTDVDDTRKPYLKFINVSGTIMSRLVLPFDATRIKKIVASPYIPDQDKVAQQLQFFTRKCGIPGVDIETHISKKIR